MGRRKPKKVAKRCSKLLTHLYRFKRLRDDSDEQAEHDVDEEGDENVQINLRREKCKSPCKYDMQRRVQQAGKMTLL